MSIDRNERGEKVSAYTLPATEFDPHPEGEHVGEIVDVIDQGLKESKFGAKEKFSIIVESETATMDDGRPFSLWIWTTKSGSAKSKLTELRQKLLRRTLTPDERRSFDPAMEMVGRKVRYMVAHTLGDNGQTYANLVSWTPAEQGEAARAVREQIDSSDAPPSPALMAQGDLAFS